MAINPSSSFNFDGVVSGLNTTSIIDKMMSLYRAPLTSLQNQQSDVQARDKAYQAVKTQLSSFQTALKTLLRPSNVNAKTAISSSTSVASVTANSDAINGSFGLTVNRLATATALTSNTPVSLGVDDGSASGAKLNASGFSTAVTAGIRMSRNFGMKMLTMTNLSTDCLLQLNKLTYDAAPSNQV